MAYVNDIPAMTGDGHIDRRSSLSIAFSILKWVLIMLVVANHFLRNYDVQTFSDLYTLSDNPLVTKLYHIVYIVIANAEVPGFLAISGYLFFGNGDLSFKNVRRSLSRRRLTLMYPFFIWNFYAILVALATVLLGVQPETWSQAWDLVKDWFKSPQHIVNGVFGITAYFPFNIPLWYIRDLIICMLLSPALVWCLRKAQWVTMGILCAFYLAGFVYVTHMWFSEPLFFFTLGMWLRMRDIRDFRIGWKKIIILFAVFTAIILASYYLPLEDGKLWNIVHNSSRIVFLFVALCAAHEVAAHIRPDGRAFGVIAFLAGASFFVYVTHHPIMAATKTAVFSVVRPGSDLAEFWTLLLAYVVIVAALTAIYWLIWRYRPTWLKPLLGRAPKRT